MTPSMRLLAVAIGSLLLACASPPRSGTLDRAASVSDRNANEQLRHWAPQALAKAEGLREQAEQAQEAGDVALANALAEHALAAFAHARVLARLASAEQRLAAAKQEKTTIEQEMQALTSMQQVAAQRADTLELEYKTVRDAEPLHPVEAADPKREAARRVAARSILEAARLLCLSAKLLDERAAADPLLGRAAELELKLEQSPSPTPIDQAVKLRSGCLQLLTDTRRAALQEAPADDAADVLFTKLAAALPDLRPFRDDRGVVVSLPAAFDRAGKLTEDTRERLQALVEVARANPSFPLMAVVHHAQQPAAVAQQAVQDWFTAHGSGVRGLKVHNAGERLPASVRPTRIGPRLEIVFVAP